jgi:phospholipase C
LSIVLAANGALPAFAASPQNALPTATPIKHVVVIFGENESFDHYFGTYPHATNPQGEPVFTAAPNTPAINGFTPDLLNNNPNLNPANGTGATNPFRLDRSQAHTSSQNHAYGPEQAAFHGEAIQSFLRPWIASRSPSSGGAFAPTGWLAMTEQVMSPDVAAVDGELIDAMEITPPARPAR